MKKPFREKLRRMLALIGVVIIFGLYLATFIFAFIDKSQSRSLLTASVFTTFIVAFILYAASLLLKLGSRKEDDDQ